MPGYYGEDDYDYHRRRRSPREYGGGQYLNPGNGGGSLHRTRSTGQGRQPVVNNIYVDQVQDANLRAESPYYPPPSPRQAAVPYPASPEFRGRSRLGEDLVEDLADLALRDRLRSRSRGRTEGALMDRPDFAEWRLEQKERELEEERRRILWEKEAELKRLKDESKQEKAEHDAEEARKRVIQDYEDKKRNDAARAKEAEAKFKEKMERDKREAKEEEERIKQKIDREKREAKEREEREWKEFLQKQREKEDKEKAEKKAEKEKIEAEMRRRLSRFGYTENQIDVMVDEEKAKKYKEEHARSPRRPSPGAQLVSWQSQQAPTYAKVHRDYLSVDTLIYYDIPYEYDPNDSNYIIIRREMDKYETEVLFEHTKRLRSGKLLLEAPKEKPNYAWYRKRDRSNSRVRKVGILEYRKVA
ncbi:hypothetical protein LTR85_003280 [Meristemomyces frigidus]|nr:hypothetical protein LTR85_003280 [Meristemomyces frigidus]